MVDFEALKASFTRWQANRHTQDDLERLEAFARQILPWTSTPADDEQGLPAADLLSLLDAVALISSSLDVEQVLAGTAEQLVNQLGVEACAISEWDPQADTLTLWVEHVLPGWMTDDKWYRPVSLSRFPVTQLVLETGQVVQCRIDDPCLDPNERAFMKQEGIQTLVMLPLTTRERTIGLLELMDRRGVRTFSQQEITTGKLLAEHAAILIDRAMLYKAAEQRAAELEAIRQASLSLTASLDLHQVLEAILSTTLQMMPDVHNADIFLYLDGHLTFGASIWQAGLKDEPFAEPRRTGLTYNVARKGQPVVVQDMRSHPLFVDTPQDWKGSIVGMPLKIGKRVVGVMNVADDKTHAFSARELNLLRLLGDHAAIAIENARLHDLVTQQARTDIVTGLHNRRALAKRLEEEVRRSDRYKRPFALIMLDMDNFKQINDTYGHPVGDQVLKQIGECLAQTVRDSDFVARFGGDEFCIVLPETDLTACEKLAGRLLEALAEYRLRLPDGGHPPLTASIGVAAYPDHASDATTILVAADRALYLAKREASGAIVRASGYAEPFLSQTSLNLRQQ